MINRLINILLFSIFICSCTTVKNHQAGKPFVISSSAKDINIIGGDFDNDERNSLKQKMATQLSDSSKVTVKDILFVYHRIKYAPAYDSVYAAISSKNLRNTLLHLGYYQAKDSFTADTAKNGGVTVQYVLTAGNPTRIDTFSYKIKNTPLQQLAEAYQSNALLKKNEPATKANVLGEINRLVDLFRNNGYYKFTPDELRMRGDTTIEALTNVDDPFETLRLLEEANRKRDKPTIKLAVVLNPKPDSTRLIKYYINNVYVYPDYSAEDAAGTAAPFLEDSIDTDSAIIRYHSPIVRKRFLTSLVAIKKGEVYSQERHNKTLANFSRTGVWQNVNMVIREDRVKDSAGKIDVHIQLVPAKKYGFENNIEVSYSSTSNINNVNVANAGNMLGLSGNVSLQSRNAARQGVKITHAVRAGVELNLSSRPGADNFINSSEVGYTGTIAIPKLIYPFNLFSAFNKLYSKQSFITGSVAHSDRIGLFKLNSFGFALGYEFNFKPYKTITIKPLNVEFTNLYDRSDAFDSAIKNNPYLRYSFNTSLVMGSTFAYSVTNSKPGSNKVTSFKGTFEESGALLYFAFPLEEVGALKKYLKKFIKIDLERTWTWTYPKKQYIIHLFGGVGVPIGSRDTTLPFFKQYFGGGPNSMRAWPIRGIGPGSQALVNYNNRTLNDRTGDMRLEANLEYRQHLAQILPNTLALKWALFADIGNVWNFKNTRPDQQFDSTQFPFRSLHDFYKQIGVNLGTGLRLDFNYVVLRLDFGFRFKRPELQENGGWKIPSISLGDLWPKLFGRGPNDEYRKWRYENFNFTISLNYPF